MSCILVVDDELELREVIADILEDAGRRVRQASNGAEALELARGHTPAAGLLDVRMPVLDGAGFLAARRAHPALRDVPVVLVSGNAADAAALAARHAGVQILPKPFRMAELLAILEGVAPA